LPRETKTLYAFKIAGHTFARVMLAFLTATAAVIASVESHCYCWEYEALLTFPAFCLLYSNELVLLGTDGPPASNFWHVCSWASEGVAI